MSDQKSPQDVFGVFIDAMPTIGSVWRQDRRDSWLAAIKGMIELTYRRPDENRVRLALTLIEKLGQATEQEAIAFYMAEIEKQIVALDEGPS